MQRLDLVSDCARCAALCCDATSFDAGAAFAFDKAAGERCRHLQPDARCAIHAALAERGLAGCAAYDCYGAGPRALRAFAHAPERVRRRNELFLELRALHELLWLLTEAAKRVPPARAELRAAIAREIAALDALGENAELARFDWSANRDSARALLRRVGEALGGRAGAARAALRLEP